MTFPVEGSQYDNRIYRDGVYRYTSELSVGELTVTGSVTLGVEKTLNVNVGTATITVPELELGEMKVIRKISSSAGTITITLPAGHTFSGGGQSITLTNQYEEVTIERVSATEWVYASKFLATEYVGVNNAVTFDPQYANYEVEINCVSAPALISITAPKFLGQHVHIVTNGNNLGGVNGGNGIYSAGVRITSKTSGLYLDAVQRNDVLVWEARDNVTADYSVGAVRVKQSSRGELQQLISAVGTTSADATPNYFGSTAGNVYASTIPYTFPVPFNAIPNYLEGTINAGVGTRVAIISTTGTTVQIIGATPSTDLSATFCFIGFY